MRIGELLLESELINAKQLADALYYGRAKALPLGRCLKILRWLTERDLKRALETQQLIRKGLAASVGVQILRSAARRGTTIQQALDEHLSAGADVFLSKPEPEPVANEAETSPARARAISPFDLMQQGDRFFAEERLADAERCYIQARNLLVGAHGEEHSEVAPVIVKLANLYLATDRFQEAEVLYRQVLELHRKLRGANDILVAKSLEDLADLYQVQGEIRKARELFAQACDIAENQSPIDVGLTGRVFKKLAVVAEEEPQEMRRKRTGEFCADAGLLAQDKVQHALKQSKQTGKPIGTIIRDEHMLEPDEVESLMLAQLLAKEGVLPYALSVRLLKLAIRAGIPLKQICEAGRIVSEDSENSQVYRQLVLEQDKLLTAENMLGPNHVEVAAIAEKLADLYVEHNDRQSALMLYKRAQGIYERAGKENTDKPRVARLCERYASALAAEGRHMEAEPMLLNALEMLQISGESDSLDAARCLFALARCQVAMGNSASAVSFLNNALALYRSIQLSECPSELFGMLADLQLEMGQEETAERTLKAGVTFAQQKFGSFDAETASHIERLGDFYQTCGRLDDAVTQYQQALEIYERNPGCQAKLKSLEAKVAARA